MHAQGVPAASVADKAAAAAVAGGGHGEDVSGDDDESGEEEEEDEEGDSVGTSGESDEDVEEDEAVEIDWYDRTDPWIDDSEYAEAPSSRPPKAKKGFHVGRAVRGTGPVAESCTCAGECTYMTAH